MAPWRILRSLEEVIEKFLRLSLNWKLRATIVNAVVMVVPCREDRAKALEFFESRIGPELVVFDF